ncbi:MAG: hypothetical protein FWC60_10165 [Firmicutes bacterium]|nr:hypothetical protein [Bacillota bacterium]
MKMTNIDFMIGYVKNFVEGHVDRLEFELDFPAYLRKRYPKMKRECPELADCFSCYLVEQGYDEGQDLPDDEYLELFQERFDQFMSVFDDGIL